MYWLSDRVVNGVAKKVQRADKIWLFLEILIVAQDTRTTQKNATADKTVKIWHRETGELVRTLSQFEKPVYSVTISPDGQTLIAGSGDPALTIWNLETGELVNTLEGHPEGVAAVAMSADGETMVSRSLTGQVKIWQSG